MGAQGSVKWKLRNDPSNVLGPQLTASTWNCGKHNHRESGTSVQEQCLFLTGSKSLQLPGGLHNPVHSSGLSGFPEHPLLSFLASRWSFATVQPLLLRSPQNPPFAMSMT